MQQQIVELTNLLKGHFTQSQTIIPETKTQNTVKRSRSEEEIEQAPKRAASSGEEVKPSASHDPQSEVMVETPSLEEDVGGNGRSNKSLNPSRTSSSSTKDPSPTRGHSAKGASKGNSLVSNRDPRNNRTPRVQITGPKPFR